MTSSPQQQPGGTNEPTLEEDLTREGTMKRRFFKGPQEGASEQAWRKGAPDSQELNDPKEMSLSSGSEVQQSAATSHRSEAQAAEPEMPESVLAGGVQCDACPNPAVKACLTCRDSYCQSCIRPHYSDPDLERHQLQDLQHSRSDSPKGGRPNFAKEETSASAGGRQCDICPNPAVKACLTCRDNYCQTCIRPHYFDPDLHRHQLQDLPHQGLCELHKRDREFYCRTDQSAICSRCFLTSHKEHDVTGLDSVRDQSALKTQTKIKEVPVPKNLTVTPGPASFSVTWAKPDGLESGSKSALQTQTKMQEVPVPMNITVTPGPTSVSVTWAKPDGLESGVQVSYLIQLFQKEELLRTTYTNNLDFSPSDLQHGIEYTVEITTILPNGCQSKLTSIPFRTVIPVPEHLTVSSITASSAHLSWQVSPEMDQTPHRFLVSYWSEETEPESISTESCSADLTDLRSGTEYSVAVCTELHNGVRSQPASIQMKIDGTFQRTNCRIL